MLDNKFSEEFRVNSSLESFVAEKLCVVAILTLFGIICHDRLFPLIVLFVVFSYSSLGCDI